MLKIFFSGAYFFENVVDLIIIYFGLQQENLIHPTVTMNYIINL